MATLFSKLNELSILNLDFGIKKMRIELAIKKKHCLFAFCYASLKRNSGFAVKISNFSIKGHFEY